MPRRVSEKSPNASKISVELQSNDAPSSKKRSGVQSRLDKVREILLELRRKYTNDDFPSDNFSTTGGDNADQASSTMAKSVHMECTNVQSKIIRQIDGALDRLRKGIYGICQQCRKTIPMTRLNAVPYTVNCVRCQGDLEAQGYDGDSLPDGQAEADSPDMRPTESVD